MGTTHKPETTKARSWQEIEAHYMHLNEHGWKHDRMLELVRHIKSKSIKDRLFAFTSLDRLVIGIYDEIEWHRETLHIEFDRNIDKWNFRYFSRPNEKPEFERQYNADLGLEKFDKFISTIKW